MNITQHFRIDEFECRDGTSYPISQIDDEDPYARPWLATRLMPLCETLEAIRAGAGNFPISINSGYRTLEYDEKLYAKHLAAVGDDGDVAPASRSQHPKGRAADITHAKIRPLVLFNLILAMYETGKLPHLGGVGLYPNFVHVDVRPRTNEGKHLAIWGGSRPDNIA